MITMRTRLIVSTFIWLILAQLLVTDANAATWYRAQKCHSITAESLLLQTDYWHFKGCITYEYTNVAGDGWAQGIRNVSAQFNGTITMPGALAQWEYLPGDLQKMRTTGRTADGHAWVQIKGTGHFRTCLIKIGLCYNYMPWIALKAYAGGGVTWTWGH